MTETANTTNQHQQDNQPQSLGRDSDAREYYIKNNLPHDLLGAMLQAGQTDPGFAGRSKADQVAILNRINNDMQNTLKSGQDITNTDSKITPAIPNMTPTGRTTMACAFSLLLDGQYAVAIDSEANNTEALNLDRDFKHEYITECATNLAAKIRSHPINAEEIKAEAEYLGIKPEELDTFTAQLEKSGAQIVQIKPQEPELEQSLQLAQLAQAPTRPEPELNTQPNPTIGYS